MIGHDQSSGVSNINIRTNTLIEYFLMDKVLKNNILAEGSCLSFNNNNTLEEQRVNALISRDMDIDIGSAIKHNHSFISTKIAQSRIIGLCRRDHPRIHDDLSEEQWINEEHAVLSSAETNAYLPEKLYSHSLKRKIRYRSFSLLNVLHCVENSDYIMFFPEFLLGYATSRFNVRSINMPWMENDTLDLYAYIHSKAKNDERLTQIIELLKS